MKLTPIERTHEGQFIVAAGPQTKQSGTIEYRIVLLRHWDESFSVHSQIFEKPNEPYLVAGKYFKTGKPELVKASKYFGELVANQASFYGSIED